MTTKKNIKHTWNKMRASKEDGQYRLNNYANNLYLLKDSKKNFGFCVTGIYNTLKYKNLKIENKKYLINHNTGERLLNCILITAKEKIDSNLLASIIDCLFEDYKGDITSFDLDKAFSEISRIVEKEEDTNDVIGVWGELYLINEILQLTKEDKIKYKIIKSWEGLNERTKIDFNLKEKKTKIEVKTTTKESRIHTMHGLSQLQKEKDWKGYLYSVCILTSSDGKSCLSLHDTILSSLNSESKNLFNQKVELRGESICKNNSSIFSISPNHSPLFIDFKHVPTPKFKKHAAIGKIEWEIILSNEHHFIEDINKILKF